MLPTIQSTQLPPVAPLLPVASDFGDMQNIISSLVLVTILTSSGCVSPTPQIASLNVEKSEDAVLLLSECNSSLQKIIANRFPFERSWDIQHIKRSKPVTYLVLSEVDGVRGTSGRNLDPSGCYNNAWNGQFEVVTVPGHKTLLVTPSSTKYAPGETRLITFEALPKKEYLVASLHRWETKGNIQVIDWAPLVVDLEKNEIVIPAGEPEWSTYCISASEFGGPTPCP